MSELRTSRLVLVPASPAQIRAILADDYARASELLGADVPVGWPFDDDAFEGLSWHLSALERDSHQRFWRIRFIIEPMAQTLIGSINLKGLPTGEGDVEIGWGLAPAARGRGFATEASRAVIDWAFQTAAVMRVSATIPEDNDSSKKVARRLGMVATAEVRRGLPVWAVYRNGTKP